VPDDMVFFATNRAEEMDKDGRVVGFTGKVHAISPRWLRYGSVQVRHAPKDEELPYQVKAGSLSLAPDVVPGVTAPEKARAVLGSDKVLGELRELLPANTSDLLLFIHGFSCDFVTGVSRAAELKHEWSPPKRDLQVAFLSWPADGSMVPWISYASDRDDARASAKAISRALQRMTEFMVKVRSDEKCEAKIHLAVHSMGAYALRHALQAWLSDWGSKPLPRIFSNIFLMAADENSDSFERVDGLARLPELAEAVHVYFARNDGALNISDATKGNPDRLGMVGPRTLSSLPHKLVLVDCSDVSKTPRFAEVGHQYYRKQPEVLADIRQVLAGKRPEEVAGREWVPSRNCFRIKAKGKP